MKKISRLRGCKLDPHGRSAASSALLIFASLVAQQAPVARPSSAPTHQTAAPATPTDSPDPGARARNGPRQRLTVQDAEALALKNNPQISVYRACSPWPPTRSRASRGRLTIPTSTAASRRSNPTTKAPASPPAISIIPSFMSARPAGVTMSQLITDFGRTHNLVASAALRAKAQNMNAAATADQIRLAVDQVVLQRAAGLRARRKLRSKRSAARQFVSEPDHHAFQQQTAIATRCQLCRRQPCASQAAAARCAEQLPGRALRTLARFLATPRNSSSIWSITNRLPSRLRPTPSSQLETQAFSNRPEIAAQNYPVRSRAALPESGTRPVAAQRRGPWRRGSVPVQRHDQRSFAVHATGMARSA